MKRHAHPLQKLFCLFLLAVSAVASAAQANLITNGGFETGTLSGWSYTGTLGSDAFISSTYAHSGSFGLGIGPFGTTQDLSQSFATVIGQSYELDFWLNNTTGGTPSSFAVSVDNFATILLSLTNTAAFNFTEYSYLFTATNTTTTLDFRVRHDPDGWGLDDIAVNAVPEPSTLILLVTGILSLRLFRVTAKR